MSLFLIKFYLIFDVLIFYIYVFEEDISMLLVVDIKILFEKKKILIRLIVCVDCRKVKYFFIR